MTPIAMIALLVTVLGAALHVYFLVLEMFLWTRPLGLKTFRNTPQKAEATRVLAANQGLYNGFLAAGVIAGLLLDQSVLVTFSLICVVVAGAYGAWTVSPRIFYIQAVPAILALVLRAL